MNSGSYVLSQYLDRVHWQTLSRLVERYDAESRVRHFGCRQQRICMAFAQLTCREGLRGIAERLNARPSTLYYLGFSESGSFYVMDRGYMDFARLHLIAQAGAFFVTRAKDNLQYDRQRSQPVDMRTELRSDQIGKPKLPKARADFPSRLRKVCYYDQKEGRDFVFLTNNLTIPALTVATLYRLRWRIELFFHWIKGHLRINHYHGTSPNAVETQIWIAV